MTRQARQIKSAKDQVTKFPDLIKGEGLRQKQIRLKLNLGGGSGWRSPQFRNPNPPEKPIFRFLQLLKILPCFVKFLEFVI